MAIHVDARLVEHASPVVDPLPANESLHLVEVFGVASGIERMEIGSVRVVWILASLVATMR